MKTLNEIGLLTGTDKANNPNHGHGYLDFYERHLQHLRHLPITLLEIGIGGEEHKDRGGQSLRMWREYFTDSATVIAGVDCYQKEKTLAPGCLLYKADQDNVVEMAYVMDLIGAPDIIIDDASHNNAKTIDTFDLLFGQLKPGGIYIYEDTHTSFFESDQYGGNAEPLHPGTSLHFLARLMCGLQVDSIKREYRQEWDGHIQEMHFMRNTCVIVKRK